MIAFGYFSIIGNYNWGALNNHFVERVVIQNRA